MRSLLAPAIFVLVAACGSAGPAATAPTPVTEELTYLCCGGGDLAEPMLVDDRAACEAHPGATVVESSTRDCVDATSDIDEGESEPVE